MGNEIKKWMEKEIKKPSSLGSNDREGFVIRLSSSIKMSEFDKYYAKYVRRGHIQTGKNWSKTWQKVKLIENDNNYKNNDNENDINDNDDNYKKNDDNNNNDNNQSKKSKKKHKKKNRKIYVSL